MRKAVATISDAGGTAKGWKLDIRDEKQLIQLFSEIEQECGRVDILINNAFISSFPVQSSTAYARVE